MDYVVDTMNLNGEMCFIFAVLTNKHTMTLKYKKNFKTLLNRVFMVTVSLTQERSAWISLSSQLFGYGIDKPNLQLKLMAMKSNQHL